MSGQRRWVLVTGCSTGIGRALVPALQAQGWGVVATARRAETLQDLPSSSALRCLPLDVTRLDSIERAVTACEDLPLVALINNAGYGQMGPLALLPVEALRAQFETNVVGLQAVTNAFLPLIQRHAAKGEGRIVHVSSVLGRLSIPMAGAYNASKHAVTALGETLRLELRGEIAVMLVEPGAIQTDFRHTIKKVWGDLPERVQGTPYERVVTQYAAKREDFAAQHGLPASVCAERIVRAMGQKRPPRRLVVGNDSRFGQIARRWLPMALFEWAMRRSYGL